MRALTIVVILLAALPAHAADIADLELVTNGLDLPSNIAAAPDGRLLIADKDTGAIRVAADGKLLDARFLAIENLAVRDEQGLLGMAVHPDGGSVFVSYTPEDGSLRLSQFALLPDGSAAIAESEEALLSIRYTGSGYAHYCGHLAFHDGALYLCVGDMDDHGNPAGTAQSLDALQGKLLRIDVSERPVQPQVVAYGVRNAWHFSFDLSGNLILPDVGWNSWEELNVLPAASSEPVNFGWPLAEGNDCRIAHCRKKVLAWPVLEMPHLGERCALIGGAIYDGEQSAWRGVYVFGDYCSGRFWALRDVAANPMIRQIGEDWRYMSSVSQGPDGELLLASFADGAVYRIEFPSDYDDGWQDLREMRRELALEARRFGVHPSKYELDQLYSSSKWSAVGWVFELYDQAARWW